jgi:hypothetical protein
MPSAANIATRVRRGFLLIDKGEAMLLSRVDIKNKQHMRNPYPRGFSKVRLPEGTSGDWSIVRYEATEDELSLFNLRLIRDGMYQRIVPPGEYTKLCNGSAVVMSDTPAEAHEHSRLWSHAQGSVLLNGLGLGFALSALLKHKEVSEITVIEKSSDVIALVEPHIRNSRVTVINADAMEWRPKRGSWFDTVWHDIWTNICQDNKQQMTALRRAYARRCGWQSCWSEEYMD